MPTDRCTRLEDEANARLMQAAPKLYALLCDAVSAADNGAEKDLRALLLDDGAKLLEEVER
jgi:hypothetical protein